MEMLLQDNEACSLNVGLLQAKILNKWFLEKEACVEARIFSQVWD